MRSGSWQQRAHSRVVLINVMNRWQVIDSKLSLDVVSCVLQNPLMIYQPYSVLIHRRNSLRNMSRFYSLSIEPSLLGGRRWGRAGRSERRLVEHFGSEREAVAAFLTVLHRKRRRGYRPEPPVPTKV